MSGFVVALGAQDGVPTVGGPRGSGSKRTLAVILGALLVLGGCGSSSESGSASTTPTPTTSTVVPTRTSVAPLPTGTPSDVTAAPTGQMGQLVAVRTAGHDGYDRLVLEFKDGVPGYNIGYRPLPMQQDASGADIPLPGAKTALQIALIPATASGWGNGERTYFGPSTVTGDTKVVTAAKAAGDFEAVLTWVVGLRSEVPFSVEVLAGPPRLVIDFRH